jgi:secretion/DNA translocation related TadE-like protein
MTRPRLDDERGAVTVLVAAILSLVTVLALITVDVVRALQSKARAQTAADAAALAAAQDIALGSTTSPAEAASEYARRNGGVLTRCRCARGSLEAVVTVKVPVELLFVGPSRFVSRTARAVVDTATGPG